MREVAIVRRKKVKQYLTRTEIFMSERWPLWVSLAELMCLKWVFPFCLVSGEVIIWKHIFEQVKLDTVIDRLLARTYCLLRFRSCSSELSLRDRWSYLRSIGRLVNVIIVDIITEWLTNCSLFFIISILQCLSVCLSIRPSVCVHPWHDTRACLKAAARDFAGVPADPTCQFPLSISLICPGLFL